MFNFNFLQHYSQYIKGQQPSKPIKNEQYFPIANDNNIPNNSTINKSTYEQNQIISNQLNLKIVSDKRQHIKNTFQYPYCSIGLLSCKFGLNWLTGTGALISGKHILTCASNIYNNKDQKYADEIYFYPACNGTKCQQYKIIKYNIMQQYKKIKYQDRIKYDYAVLEIQSDISEKYGFFGLDFTVVNMNQYVQMCGYPADKIGKYDKTMWNAIGQIKQISSNIIYYDFVTQPGNCGSPIFKFDIECSYIVGIHSHTNNFKQLNGGLVIDKNLIKKVYNLDIKITSFLNLNYTKFGYEGMKQLINFSKNYNDLTRLQLSYNQIDDKQMELFVKVSKNFKQLKQLNLSQNNIDQIGMKYFIEASKNFTQLEKLNFNQNYYLKYPRIGLKKGIMINLSIALKNFKQLKYLYLQINEIGDQQMQHLSEALKKVIQLRELNLDSNNIGDKGIKYFSDSTHNLINLKKLCLAGNNFTQKGMQYLANRIKNFTQLQFLDLSGQRLGDKGTQYLALALKEFSQLIFLDLHQTSIGDEGMKNLAISLKNCTKLQCLYLQCNKIGDEGMKHLANTLKYCNQLKCLQLWSNKFGTKGLQYFANASISFSKKIYSFDMENNHIGAQGEKFIKIMEKNIGNNIQIKYSQTHPHYCKHN